MEDEGYKEIALKLGSGLVQAPLYDGNEKLSHDVKRNAHYIRVSMYMLNF